MCNCFPLYVWSILTLCMWVFFLYVCFKFVYVEGLWSCPTKFRQSLLCKAFCLLKESEEIFSFALLFYFFQSPIVHQVALTFGNHTTYFESKIFGSLLFLFWQILVRVLWLYQNKPCINLFFLVWKIKIKKQNNP